MIKYDYSDHMIISSSHVDQDSEISRSDICGSIIYGDRNMSEKSKVKRVVNTLCYSDHHR